MQTAQTCKTCKESKPFSDFYKGATKTGYRYECKACFNVKGKSRYHSMSDAEKAAKMQNQRLYVAAKKYHLSPEKYLEMLAQGCAVCGKDTDLNIDHDHRCCPGDYTCGKCVVGVLCGSHNRAEGLVGNVDNAVALLAYMITKYQGDETNG